MAGVRRFTTRYDPTEDRIKLLVELTSDDVRVLMLTRRLLNRLLPALLQGLEKAPAVTEVPKPQAQAAQRFAQTAAVSGIAKQKAVAPAADVAGQTTQYLVSSIDLQSGKGGLSLHFKSGETLVQAMPLNEDGLRQWLNVMFRQYEAGGWHETFWPKWVKPGTTSSADLRLN